MRKLLLVFVALVSSPTTLAQSSNEVLYQIVTDRFFDGDAGNNCGQNDPTLDDKAKMLNRLTCDPTKTDWNKYWGGDFAGIVEKLPYLKSLGVTAIWISPIIENARGLASGDGVIKTAYHGFWGRDWFRLNEHWTTKGTRDVDSFKHLVAEAKKAGIGVIVDTVVNHTSPAYDAEFGALYDNGKKLTDYAADPLNGKSWFHHHPGIRWDLAEGAGSPTLLRPYMFQHELKLGLAKADNWPEYQRIPHSDLQYRMLQDYKLADLADLDTAKPQVQAYMKRAHDWLLSLGIMGYRIDTVRHIPSPYWKGFVSHLLSSKPDFFLVGEWYGGGPGNDDSMAFVRDTGMTIFDFKFRAELRELFLGKKDIKAFTQFLLASDAAKDLVTFVDNHDMPRMQSEGATDAEVLEMLKILFAVRGVPCVYYGLESFVFTKTEGGKDPYNRDMMTFPSDPERHPGVSLVSRLSALRKKHPSLRSGATTLLALDPARVVLSRRLGGDEVLIQITKTGKAETPKGFHPVSLPSLEGSRWTVSYFERD